MSKVPFTINVDQYVCTELERMRVMIKTLDFSGLAASIERVQLHVTAMEDALYKYSDVKHSITKKVKDTEVLDAEFRLYVTNKLEELNN